MNENTNENNLNNLDGTNYDNDTVIDLENAFSDLISEFFETENTAQNIVKANNKDIAIENASTNITNNNILYSNLETLQTQEGYPEENAGSIDQFNVQAEENIQTNNIYNKLGDITTDEATPTAYNIISFAENQNNLMNQNAQVNDVQENNVTEENITKVNNVNTDFKLTQGNLPAKIGFWTKVRNFFMPESKLQYSLQQANNTNTGIWNKLQNFFSFGNK